MAPPQHKAISAAVRDQNPDLWISFEFAKASPHDRKENTNPLETGSRLWEAMATTLKSEQMATGGEENNVGFHVPMLSKVPLDPFTEPITSQTITLLQVAKNSQSLEVAQAG